MARNHKSYEMSMRAWAKPTVRSLWKTVAFECIQANQISEVLVVAEAATMLFEVAELRPKGNDLSCYYNNWVLAYWCVIQRTQGGISNCIISAYYPRPRSERPATYYSTRRAPSPASPYSDESLHWKVCGRKYEHTKYTCSVHQTTSVSAW